jgi:flagellar hook assembly protein FlgD
MIDKKNTSLYLYGFLLIGAIVLFSSFKNKGKKLTGSVFVDQTDAPSGTQQVYSKVGTKVYNRNGELIYTYDTANLGMTVTQNNPDGTISIVFGDTFQNGLPGFVYSNEIQTI